jgi:hypothetical protein
VVLRTNSWTDSVEITDRSIIICGVELTAEKLAKIIKFIDSIEEVTE